MAGPTQVDGRSLRMRTWRTFEQHGSLMTLAFSVTETMRGVHHFVDPARGTAVDRPIRFRIDWGAPIRTSLNPLSGQFMRHRAAGEFYAEALTPHPVACEGTFVVDYFGQHKITYDLRFPCEGERFRFVGEKIDVWLRRPLQLVKTHTTCYGTVTNGAGVIVSRSVLHFPLETMRSFLLSLRLRRAAQSS